VLVILCRRASDRRRGRAERARPFEPCDIGAAAEIFYEIVSVWADRSGCAAVWRRIAGEFVGQDVRFRPWIVLDRADDIDVRVTAPISTSGDELEASRPRAL
jgi:hypothetical protein